MDEVETSTQKACFYLHQETRIVAEETAGASFAAEGPSWRWDIFEQSSCPLSIDTGLYWLEANAYR